MRRFLIPVGLLVLAVLAGYWFALQGGVSLPIEAPQASFVQSDGSTVLQRVQNASGPVLAVPAGAKVIRKIQVQAKVASAPEGCPPVQVDLSYVKMPDGTHRTVAAVLDGEVLGGFDAPMQQEYSAPKVWAVGVLRDTRGNSGIWVERDYKSIRFGIAARTSTQGVHSEARVGFTF